MKARNIGSGWHSQSIRHSNARRFGRAGGKYLVSLSVNPKGFIQTHTTKLKPYKAESHYNSKELAMGKRVELEHSNDKMLASIIARQHLEENLRYYSDLKKASNLLGRKFEKADNYKTIARKTLLNNKEKTKNINLGKCRELSEKIQKQLNNKKIENIIINPYFINEDKGISSGGHQAVYLPKQKLVIDTQTQQFTKNKSSKKNRKIIFTIAEYKKLGFGDERFES